MAGVTKTIEDNRKFECSVCTKVYTLKGPFSKHIDKCMKETNQQNKEITSQTTEETNKNDETLSEADEILIEDN